MSTSSATSAGMREKLAECAFELFAQRGFRSVNLEQITLQAGVTKGSLYWHYKSKKDLILAACDLYYQNWFARTADEIEKAGDNGGEALRGVLRFSVISCLFDRKNRVFTTEVFALSLQDQDVRQSWAGFYQGVRDRFIQLVQATADAGKISVENPSYAVDMMLSAIEGIKLRAVFEPEICEIESIEGFVEELLKIVSASTIKLTV